MRYVTDLLRRYWRFGYYTQTDRHCELRGR